MAIDVSTKIADRLAEVLKERFADAADLIEAARPIIGPLVSLGIAEGQAAVDRVADGLAAEDNYPAWRAIYEQASDSERVALNDAARKRLLVDAIGSLRRNKQLWDVLKITAGVIGSAVIAVL